MYYDADCTRTVVFSSTHLSPILGFLTFLAVTLCVPATLASGHGVRGGGGVAGVMGGGGDVVVVQGPRGTAPGVPCPGLVVIPTVTVVWSVIPTVTVVWSVIPTVVVVCTVLPTVVVVCTVLPTVVVVYPTVVSGMVVYPTVVSGMVVIGSGMVVS